MTNQKGINMKYCSACATPLENGNAYCPECGHKVQAPYDQGKDVAKGAIAYTFSTMALGALIVTLWLAFMFGWFLVFGSSVVVWIPAVVALVLALGVSVMLQNWWAGAKRKAVEDAA